MPIGKKVVISPSGQRTKSPNRVTAQSGDSSFLFTAAKHPPGYLLSLVFCTSNSIDREYLHTG